MNELTVFKTLSLDPVFQADEASVLFRASFYFRLKYLPERFVGLEKPGLYWVRVFHFLALQIRRVIIFQLLDKSFPVIFFLQFILVEG